MLTFRGETKHITDWSELLGSPFRRLSGRINKGWSHERALDQRCYPPRGKSKRRQQPVGGIGGSITAGQVAYGTGADTIKAALFLVTATINASTTTYSTTGELSATGNYTAGGVTVTNAVAPTTSGTTSYWTPSASFQWTTFTSSGAFDCAQLYNSTQGNRTISVHTFSSQSITSGTFTLTMPTNDATNAILRIA
jgi:hypothetical protein